jgi:isochorismate hydrolase
MKINIIKIKNSLKEEGVKDFVMTGLCATITVLVATALCLLNDMSGMVYSGMVYIP